MSNVWANNAVLMGAVNVQGHNVLNVKSGLIWFKIVNVAFAQGNTRFVGNAIQKFVISVSMGIILSQITISAILAIIFPKGAQIAALTFVLTVKANNTFFLKDYARVANFS